MGCGVFFFFLSGFAYNTGHTNYMHLDIYTWVIFIASNTKDNSKKEIYVMCKESGGRHISQAHLTPVLVLCISIGLLSFQSQAGGIIGKYVVSGGRDWLQLCLRFGTSSIPHIRARPELGHRPSPKFTTDKIRKAVAGSAQSVGLK